MKQATIFSSQRVQSSENSQTPQIQLMRGEAPCGDPVNGAVIDAQYQVDKNEYLLFITDDVPYEETLRVYLVTGEGSVLDELEFGGYLATGSLEELTIVDERTIEFSFIHKKRCRLTVEADRRWQKPLSFAPGVSRPGWFKKRLLALDFVT